MPYLVRFFACFDMFVSFKGLVMNYFALLLEKEGCSGEDQLIAALKQ